MGSIAAPADASGKLPDATLLALDRTRLAFERTTMAWVRTAMSLITFGFSIYKFFQIEAHREEAGHAIGAREFALMMISIGLIALLIGSVQHVMSMRTLRAHYRGAPMPLSLAAVVGGLMSALGVIALFVVIFRG